MRFIIIGAGDVGTHLSLKLARHGHNVVLVESDGDKLDSALTVTDLKIVLGNGAAPEILLAAGIRSADYVIAVTNSDEVNIAACFTSRLLNPAPKRIARVRDIHFVAPEIPPELLSEYFDLIINPEQAGSEYLLQLFHAPGAKEIMELGFGKVRIISLGISADSPLVRTRLDELKSEQQTGPLMVAAIIRNNKLMIPRGDEQLRVNDVAYFVTTPEETERAFTLAGRTLIEGKTAMVWGGTSFARFLAVALDKERTSLKLILGDETEQLQMADELKTTLVLSGDGTDQSLLLQEHITETDAFIAASPDEESNVLAALLAKRLGARTVMALVNKTAYLSLVSAVGVDVVISSSVAAASAIFKHIHSRSMISEITLQSEGAGFLEIDISREMPISGRPLNLLKLPYGITVAMLLREGRIFVPSEQEVLSEGDRVIFFVLKSAVAKLEKLLQMRLETFI